MILFFPFALGIGVFASAGWVFVFILLFLPFPLVANLDISVFSPAAPPTRPRFEDPD